MELKVWFEGVPREVCGVTEVTTCADVVLALAQAASLTGRYTLMEQWKGSERPLAPDECPLMALTRFGDKAGEVQFILRRKDSSSQKSPQNHQGSNPDTSMRRSETFGTGVSGSKDYECSPDDLRQKLKDHLSYQEQEIEFNRIRLMQLDRDLGSLDLCSLVEDSELKSRLETQRQELAQLQSINWADLLAAERNRAAQLKGERAQWEAKIRDTEQRLNGARDQVKRLEGELVLERERQLAQLESANQRRREELARLEAELQKPTSQNLAQRPLLSNSVSRPTNQHQTQSKPDGSGLWV